MLHGWWWFNQDFYHNAGPLLTCTHLSSQTTAKIIQYIFCLGLSSLWALGIGTLQYSSVYLSRMLFCPWWSVLVSYPISHTRMFNVSWPVRECSLIICYSQHAEWENQSPLYCFVHTSPTLTWGLFATGLVHLLGWYWILCWLRL